MESVSFTRHPFTWFHLPIDLTDSDGFAVQCFLALVAFHQLDSTSAAAPRGTCRHGSNVSWEPTTPCRLTEFGGSASQDSYNSRMCHLHSLTISIHFLLILKHCKTLFQNCSLGRPRFRILDAFFVNSECPGQRRSWRGDVGVLVDLQIERALCRVCSLRQQTPVMSIYMFMLNN